MKFNLKVLLFTVFLFSFCGILNPYKAFAEWINYTSENSSLANNNVTDIFIEDNGDKWISTDGGGLNKINANGTWETFNKNNSNISNNIYDIEEDTSSHKWFATKDGLFKYNADAPAGLELSSYTTTNSDLPGNIIENIAISSSNILWAATDSAGIARYSIAQDTWTIYTTLDSLSSNLISDIHIDSITGNCWAATKDAGLNKFDSLSWSIFTTDNSDIAANFLWTAVPDNESNILVGTKGFGLSILSNSGTWKTYTNENSALRDNTVQSITVNQVTGDIWIGTLGGVTKYTGSSWTTYNTETSPILSNFINSITIDYSNGAIWMATAEGITVLIERDIITNQDNIQMQGGPNGYVNPDVGELLTIHYNTATADTLKFSIYTLNGQLVFEKTINTASGSGSTTWNCTNTENQQIASGIYIVHAKGKNLDISKKVAIVR